MLEFCLQAKTGFLIPIIILLNNMMLETHSISFDGWRSWGSEGCRDILICAQTCLLVIGIVLRHSFVQLLWCSLEALYECHHPSSNSLTQSALCCHLSIGHIFLHKYFLQESWAAFEIAPGQLCCPHAHSLASENSKYLHLAGWMYLVSLPKRLYPAEDWDMHWSPASGSWKQALWVDHLHLD